MILVSENNLWVIVEKVRGSKVFPSGTLKHLFCVSGPYFLIRSTPRTPMFAVNLILKQVNSLTTAIKGDRSMIPQLSGPWS